MTRAVISGVGIVAPNGLGTAANWNAARTGISGIRPIERFDPAKHATRVAGMVEGFEVTDYVDKRLSVQTDHWTQMALAAPHPATWKSPADAMAREFYSWDAPQ